MRIQQLAPGMVQQIQSVCHECQGQGERINPKDRCKTCQGRKIVRERKILEVHIDKGNALLSHAFSKIMRKGAADGFETGQNIWLNFYLYICSSCAEKHFVEKLRLMI